MKKHCRLAALAISSSLLLTPAIAQADMLAGIYVGGQIWDMQSSGSFGEKNQMHSFDLNDETKGTVWIAVEHPIPLLPNVKVRYNQLDVDGDTDVDNFKFAGNTYTGNTSVDSELNHFDFILYYEILDNDIISVDVGLNGKYGDFKVKMDGTVAGDNGGSYSASGQESYKGLIPLGYVAAEVGLPLTGLGVYGEANWIGYDDSHAHDVQGGVYWYLLDNLAVDASLRVGYRHLKFDIEDVSGLYMDTEFKGLHAGLELHF